MNYVSEELSERKRTSNRLSESGMVLFVNKKINNKSEVL